MSGGIATTIESEAKMGFAKNISISEPLVDEIAALMADRVILAGF